MVIIISFFTIFFIVLSYCLKQQRCAQSEHEGEHGDADGK